MALTAGTRIGPFEILSLLGTGGMGEVYRALDIRLRREVAIKFIRADVSSDPERLRRFEQEARAAGALNHPNVLAVHEVGTHEGAPYLVTELLEGVTLRQRLRSGGLTAREAVDCSVQIARGLAAAHEKGIVHRDLKPENVFLTKHGGVKVLDFGLAKLRVERSAGGPDESSETATAQTDAGVVLGTAAYMSPEQVRALPVDHRSDIFSLGTVLFEMLSRRRPFSGETTPEIMTAILKEDPPDLASLTPAPPAPLERIVRRCLEKSPEQRFHSAHDLALALEAVSGGSSSGARTRDLPTRGAHPRWAALAVLPLVSVAVGVAFMAGRHTGVPPSPAYRPLTFRRGAIGSARFAPDGQSVVYSARWDGEGTEVFAARLDGPLSRHLGLPGLSVAATAPGEMALLTDEGTLGRAPLDGGPFRAVTDGVDEADWTSSGSEFALVRTVAGRQRLEFPAGKVLHETDGLGRIVNPRLSPADDKVAFVERRNFTGWAGSVTVVDRAGSPRRLSTEWTDLDGLAWSPDGTEVWFTAAKTGFAKALHAVTLTGRERLVQRVPGRLALHDISPDGRVLLAVERLRWELQGLLPGDTVERNLSWLDGTAAPLLTDDGSVLLFNEAGEGGGPRSSTYMRRPAGGPAVRLGDGGPLDLSPDGKWVLCQVEEQLSLVPIGAGDTIALPRGPIAKVQWAWFFPDGKRILITGNEAGRPTRLFMQELPDGTPRPITPENTAVGAGVFSADGQFVGAASPREGAAPLRMYPVAGGEPRPLPGIEASDYVAEWSGDRRFLFVIEPGRPPVRVFRLDMNAGTRTLWRTLAPADPAGVWSIYSVSLTSDGRSYVYGFLRTLEDLYVVEGLR